MSSRRRNNYQQKKKKKKGGEKVFAASGCGWRLRDASHLQNAGISGAVALMDWLPPLIPPQAISLRAPWLRLCMDRIGLVKS
jgi:hypothetical protein